MSGNENELNYPVNGPTMRQQTNSSSNAIMTIMRLCVLSMWECMYSMYTTSQKFGFFFLSSFPTFYIVDQRKKTLQNDVICFSEGDIEGWL